MERRRLASIRIGKQRSRTEDAHHTHRFPQAADIRYNKRCNVIRSRFSKPGRSSSFRTGERGPSALSWSGGNTIELCQWRVSLWQKSVSRLWKTLLRHVEWVLMLNRSIRGFVLPRKIDSSGTIRFFIPFQFWIARLLGHVSQ